MNELEGIESFGEYLKSFKEIAFRRQRTMLKREEIVNLVRLTPAIVTAAALLLFWLINRQQKQNQQQQQVEWEIIDAINQLASPAFRFGKKN